MAEYTVDKIEYGGNIYKLQDNESGFVTTEVFYGTCATGASTAAKVVTCETFTSSDLKPGVIIIVNFSATNSAAVGDLTLNVNSTGAKKIQYINNGTRGNLSDAAYLKASTSYPFIYDGTYWLAQINYNSNTTYSAGTAALIEEGTNTSNRVWQAKILHDYIEAADNLFIVEYGVTTFADAKAAYDAGKMLVCKVNDTDSYEPNQFMPLTYYDADGDKFAFSTTDFSGGNTYGGRVFIAYLGTSSPAWSIINRTFASLESPTFTGTPMAPTATAGTNTTQIATTAFVKTAVDNSALPKTTTTPKMDGTAAIGSETKYAAGDHVHPSDTSRVPTSRTVNGKALSSNVTLTGDDIKATPPSSADNSTIYDWLTSLYSDKAPLTSPALTGTPTAPTATAGTNTTQIATTAFVKTAVEGITIPTITLNGTATTSPSFYAPTTVGTNGYVLKSNGSGAPTWTAFPTIPNNFGIVKVDSTNIEADTTRDTLELVAGNNITLTPDATNDKVTIAATDTTYSAGTSALIEAGTDTSNRVWQAKILHDYIASMGNNLFVAEYGVTTYTDTKAALDAEKVIIAIKEDTDGQDEYIQYALMGNWDDASTSPVFKFYTTSYYLSGGVAKTSAPRIWSLTSSGWADNISGYAATFPLPYGVCDTAAATTAKTVTLDSNMYFKLVTGASVFVKFTNANSGAVGSITLNVNSTGAKSIKRYGTTNLAAAGNIKAGQIIQFVYDGTNWLWVGDLDTDTKVSTAAVTSGTTYYPVVGSDTTSAATKYYDKTGLVYKGTNGTTSAVGGAELTLGNSTASGTANNKQGKINLYGSTAYATTLVSGAPTAARTITLPNETGTLALNTVVSQGSSTTSGGLMSQADKTRLDGIPEHIELTQAEYDALSTAEKNNGTVYFITDVDDTVEINKPIGLSDTSWITFNSSWTAPDNGIAVIRIQKNSTAGNGTFYLNDTTANTNGIFYISCTFPANYQNTGMFIAEKGHTYGTEFTTNNFSGIYIRFYPWNF